MPFIGGFAVYGDIIDEVAAAGYKGFVMSPAGGDADNSYVGTGPTTIGAQS